MRNQPRHWVRNSAIGCALALQALRSIAAEPSGTALADGGAAILPVIANTALIVAVVIALGWIVKRAGLPIGTSTGSIKILASQSIGAKEKILVIEVGDKQLVVGSTPGQISTLHCADSPLIERTEAGSNSAFGQRLSAILQGKSS